MKCQVELDTIDTRGGRHPLVITRHEATLQASGERLDEAVVLVGFTEKRVYSLDSKLIVHEVFGLVIGAWRWNVFSTCRRMVGQDVVVGPRKDLWFFPLHILDKISAEECRLELPIILVCGDSSDVALQRMVPFIDKVDSNHRGVEIIGLGQVLERSDTKVVEGVKVRIFVARLLEEEHRYAVQGDSGDHTEHAKVGEETRVDDAPHLTPRIDDFQSDELIGLVLSVTGIAGAVGASPRCATDGHLWVSAEICNREAMCAQLIG